MQMGEHDRDAPYTEVGFGDQDGFAADRDEAEMVVSGQCPGCHGRTVFAIRKGMPEGTKGLPEGVAPEERAVTIYCECGYPHANRPADAVDRGCGAYWKVRLPR